MTDNVVSKHFGDNYTPEQTLLGALELADEMQTVIVVAVDNESSVRIGSSTGGSLEKIGLATIALQRLIEAAREE